MGYQSLTTFLRRAEAIAAWNKRVGEERKEAEILEMLCGADYTFTCDSETAAQWLEAQLKERRAKGGGG